MWGAHQNQFCQPNKWHPLLKHELQRRIKKQKNRKVKDCPWDDAPLRLVLACRSSGVGDYFVGELIASWSSFSFLPLYIFLGKIHSDLLLEHILRKNDAGPVLLRKAKDWNIEAEIAAGQSNPLRNPEHLPLLHHNLLDISVEPSWQIRFGFPNPQRSVCFRHPEPVKNNREPLLGPGLGQNKDKMGNPVQEAISDVPRGAQPVRAVPLVWLYFCLCLLHQHDLHHRILRLLGPFRHPTAHGYFHSTVLGGQMGHIQAVCLSHPVQLILQWAGAEDIRNSPAPELGLLHGVGSQRPLWLIDQVQSVEYR